MFSMALILLSRTASYWMRLHFLLFLLLYALNGISSTSCLRLRLLCEKQFSSFIAHFLRLSATSFGRHIDSQKKRRKKFLISFSSCIFCVSFLFFSFEEEPWRCNALFWTYFCLWLSKFLCVQCTLYISACTHTHTHILRRHTPLDPILSPIVKFHYVIKKPE